MARLISLLKMNANLIRPGFLAQGIVIGANVLGLSHYTKHVILLKYSQRYTERHGDYGPDEPADELKNMLDEIISKDLKDLASENTPVGLFLTPGMETTRLGTLGTITGSFVGVPVFYEFKNEDDIKEKIMITNVNDDFEIYKEKGDCFLLSDKAKKYGIAREVLLINTLLVYINSLSPFLTSLLVVALYVEMNKIYHIMKKPLYMRIIIYTAIILAGFNLWKFVCRNVLHYYECEVEEKITQLGMDYVEGGIEYCTKEIERNSLPVRVKDEKLRVLTVIDDLFGKFMPRSIPVAIRLEFLQEYRENIKNLKQ